MKIGIYTGSWKPNIGGGFSFFETVFGGIDIYNNKKHIFYIFYEGKNETADTENIKFVSLSDEEFFAKKKKTNNNFRISLNRLIKKIPGFRNVYFKIDQLEKQNAEFSKIVQNFTNEQNQYSNNLNRKAFEYKIDLMWFLTFSFSPVQVPFIYTLWDLAHRNYPCFPEVNYTGWTWEDREKLYSNVLRKATYIIAGTDEGKKEIQNYYNVKADRIKIIPFPPTLFRPDLNKSDIKITKPYIFYPAQFWPHKNHICILKALKILNDKHSVKIKCIFTGSDKGNEKYIKQKASELKLDEYLDFKGFVEKEDIKYLYENALALVFPSFFGPDNIPPVEAFSLGCPVIASDIPGAREQMKDAALFFETTDEEQLANSIKLLIDDDNLRSALIEKGHKLVKSISVENYYTEINKLFDDFSKVRRCWDSENVYSHL